MRGTVRGWQSWSALHQAYQGPYADLVHHSGRVLQALTYAPSGAIVAAPTTSLPEQVGGSRNWDYRYAWVRDASLTLSALWVAACPDEVAEFFGFFMTAAGGTCEGEDPVQILYGVGGERRLDEQELDHLGGYRDSRPVRVGNGAWRQSQLDVYGELLDAAGLDADRVASFDDATASFLADLADRAAARWEEPDHGFASALMIPIVGFLPAGDDRVRATVAAVGERLTDERGLVYRYRGGDGLDGSEASFGVCTYWLAHALALAGDVEGARRRFDTVTSFANDVGLLSEEIDGVTGELLGNFAQAFTHIGLVNAAHAIAEAEAGARPR